MVNLNVSVPAGQIPGNTLTVVTPSGQSLTVIIPAGVAAGGTFQITVPDNIATAAAVTMAVPTEVPAPAVPVRASIDTGTPVIGRAIGQAQANSGLAPMETSVSRGPPQPTQRVKQAKEAVFCTSAATMVFSIFLIGTVGGILGLATSSTISCCTTGHIKLAKKAKEIRALAISALAFTATGALIVVAIGGALLADGSNCAAESPYDLDRCSSYPSNIEPQPRDIPYNGTKGPGFVEAGGGNSDYDPYSDGCSPDYCMSPDGWGGTDCFAPAERDEACTCSQGQARVYAESPWEGTTLYHYTCCTNSGLDNPPVVGESCGHHDSRYSGAEFRSSDCSGAPVRTWYEPIFFSDEASAAGNCFTDDGSWSVDNQWCDDSGAQMRLKYVDFPSVGDCTGAERYDQDHPADGSCVDMEDGTSYRFYCGGHVDEFPYAVESDVDDEGGDNTKCRDYGDDCCANQANGEWATCEAGYYPSHQPQSYDDCPNYTCLPGDDHDYCPITREFCESDEDLPDNCNCGDCGYPACGDCDCDHYGEHCCTGNDH